MPNPSMETGLKICTRCGRSLPITHFRAELRVRSGLQAACGECQNKTSADARRKYSARYAKAKLEWERAHPKCKTEYRRTYRRRHSQARVCESAVYVAVHMGRLTKPNFCEDCARQFPKDKIHGHHANYGKPLEVAWLCHQCHAKRHNHSVNEAAK